MKMMLIWGKDGKEIEEKLNEWNFNIKEYGLKVNKNKMVIMRISWNL
jgi:hypothetical protein